jgi:arylsulfatase A-like enzyme
VNPLSRRAFLSGSGAAVAQSVALTGSSRLAFGEEAALLPSRSASGQQNMILFVPDELRADALACYGNEVTKTPNFDRFAKEGTRFDQCHVSYPICGASRCALLTGWPTSVRGHRSQQYFLRPDEPNLFRYLKEGGYDVYWFGKNDALADASFTGSVTSWNYVDNAPLVNGAGGAARSAHPPHEIVPFLYDTDSEEGDPKRTFDYKCVQAAIQILQRKQKDKPFCIFLAQGSPHPPYNAPGNFGAMYSASSIPDLLPATLAHQPHYRAAMREAYGMTKTSVADLKAVRAAYYGKVSYSDWLFGELTEAVEASGHAKDTALFVFSDHGDYAGDYGLVEKWPSGMEDCMTRVPMIARMPGGTQGHVIGNQVQQYDVMATCLELGGVQAQHTHFSRSMVGQMNGAAGEPERAAFVEGGYNVYEPQCYEVEPPKSADYYARLHLQRSQPETVSRCAAVKTGKYSFVSRPQGDSELYILADDPKQVRNRFGEVSARSMQQDAEQRLLHWYVNTTGISPWSRDPRGFPAYIPFPDFAGISSTAILDE